MEAFEKMLQEMPNGARSWNTAEDVYNWWLYQDKQKPIEGQQAMDLKEETIDN